MTKKQNTIVFIALGTIANIVLTIVLIVGLLFLTLAIFQENAATIIPFVFIIAVVLAMFIYQKSVKFIVKKFNLEEKMEPLFGRKRR